MLSNKLRILGEKLNIISHKPSIISNKLSILNRKRSIPADGASHGRELPPMTSARARWNTRGYAESTK